MIQFKLTPNAKGTQKLCLKRHYKYKRPLNYVGSGALTLRAVENLRTIYSQPSASGDSTNRSLCSTVVFTTEKNLHISRPEQFKPVLFKGQLYMSRRQKDIPGREKMRRQGV